MQLKKNLRRDSKIPTYQRMWSFMESAKPSTFMKSHQEGVFMKNNQEGIDAVKAGNGLYAFLMESTTIDYVVERECDTTQIGGLLGKKLTFLSILLFNYMPVPRLLGKRCRLTTGSSGTMSTEGQQARSELELDLDLTLKETAHIFPEPVHFPDFAK